MSRLQIKKLEGPDEIRLNTDTDTTYTSEVSTNIADQRFICYFNREIRTTDVFPVRVRIKIYDNEGNLQNTFPLDVGSNNVNDADTEDSNFCFTVNLNSPETLSGSYFYVHAVIEPIVGEQGYDPNAEYVSYPAGSYHETIKKVYIYARKQFQQVYWSLNEQITHEERTATREGPRMGNIGRNEDALLHIKTIGMYKDNIAVILTAENDSIILKSQHMRMKQNRRVVAFNMAEVIQRYRRLSGQFTGDVTFTIKAWVAVRNTDSRNAFLAPSILDVNFAVQDEISRILPATGLDRLSPLIIQAAGELTVTCTDSDPAVKCTSTGTVYVRLNFVESPEVIPTKFRDFRIGFMCHIEGVGRTVNREDNTDNNETRYTVYPFHVYEIMLSDLVACNLVTIDEAVYLTTTNNDGINLRERDSLEGNFDKINALLSAATALSPAKTLISVFRDANNANRAKESTIRKLLAQVSVKNHYFSNNLNEYNNIREICRDAWQKISKRGGVITKYHRRPDDHRYSTNKECPPGEYFLNYLPNTYTVYVSRYPDSRNIDSYAADRRTGRSASPNPVLRSGIALHKGGSRASTGCLTFNMLYDGNGLYTAFYNTIFPETNNNRKLNFICIDERNVIRVANSDPDTYRGGRRRVYDTSIDTYVWLENGTYDFHRFYDLIEPNNDLRLNF